MMLLASPIASAQFNIQQREGSHLRDDRDDLLWHSEAANVVYKNAGNISITSPTRYGLTPRWELSTILAADYLLPNITAKRLWWKDKKELWYFSTKWGLNYSSIGLKWAQSNGYTDVVDTAVNIPHIIGTNAELLVSRVFRGDGICKPADPWLILTASFNVATGISLQDNDLMSMRGHFLTNRGEMYAARGFYTYLKMWADYKWRQRISLHGGIRYYVGTFTGGHSLEQQTELELFPIKFASISLGYVLSVAKYKSAGTFGIIPFADISIYFGHKQQKENKLFQPGVMNMYNRN